MANRTEIAITTAARIAEATDQIKYLDGIQNPVGGYVIHALEEQLHWLNQVGAPISDPDRRQITSTLKRLKSDSKSAAHV
jgi:phage protein U